jgi:hypothetical protein
MAVLTVQNIAANGSFPTLGAANGGGDETADVGPGTFVYVVNGGGAPITVTFKIPVAVKGTVTYAKVVAAGGRLLMPIPARNAAAHAGTGIIGQATSNNATWTYSGVTSVTVAVVRVP